MLTNYNGTAITYDGVGNPLQWWNANSLEWSARELQKTTIRNGNTVTYTYNSDGIRTGKVFTDRFRNTTYTHNYTLDGTKIVKEYIDVYVASGSTVYELYYIYDDSGSVIGMHYNGTPYYFQKNLQGDVVRIVNSIGEVVVEYTYDAWGKVLTATGTLASTVGKYNPFRYRSYYYDTETGWYYLQSRYYDPTVGRFLNADGYVSTGQGFVGNNMFAYCGNNPVTRYDSNGVSWEDVWEYGKKLLRKVVDELYSVAVVVSDAVGIDLGDCGAAVLDMDESDDGIYHARSDGWQRYFGYSIFYDEVFDACTYMESRRFEFNFDGDTYVIWIWKGDYLNLGAGAELGIYRETIFGWECADYLNMKMKIGLSYRDKQIGWYIDNTWWITCFNAHYQNKHPDDLTATYYIRFFDMDMYHAFANKYGESWMCMDRYGIALYRF